MRYSLFMLLAIPAFAGQVSLFPRQPGGGFSAIQIDRAGNIYVAGAVAPPNAKTGDAVDAVVAKLSADGSLVYKSVLGGSALDEATAIALGTDGSVYVAGFTLSKDFPVTSGALQSTLGTANGGQAFLAKLSPNGQVQTATYFGGSAPLSGSAIAIANTGEVYLTGTSNANVLQTTPSGSGNGFFLAKFDANLSQVLFSTLAYGGTVLALDPQGNIYTAGAAFEQIGGNVLLQAGPGAFQGSAPSRICQGGGIVFLPCSYQFVEKLDPTGTKLGYATFLTGSFGASPAGIAVDAAGNVIVAGTTNSADYPVTAQALQTMYLANAAAPPVLPSPHPEGDIPPPSTGYITKLNADGTGLIWSTLFGGSVQDAISGMVVDANGYIYITGQANSSDLPGLSASDPAGCRPAVNEGLGFVARVSPDGTSLSPTQLIYGAPVCTYASCAPDLDLTSSQAWALAVKPDGRVIAAGGRLGMAEVDLFASQRLACFTDPADNVQLTTVAPGQVFSIFGSHLAPPGAAVPPGGSASGISVTFNGVAAPILYISSEQINIQVPYEIAGLDSVEMQVVSPGEGLMERKTLPVVQQMPSVFLSLDALLSDLPGNSYCGNAFSRNQHALALNSDGTLNTCSNGALPGSTVTIFMNGLGPTQPPQTTGTIAAGPPVAIAPGATGTGVLSTTTFPGAISGVVQVQVQVQPTSAGFLEVVPTVAGVLARESVVIWLLTSQRLSP